MSSIARPDPDSQAPILLRRLRRGLLISALGAALLALALNLPDGLVVSTDIFLPLFVLAFCVLLVGAASTAGVLRRFRPFRLAANIAVFSLLAMPASILVLLMRALAGSPAGVEASVIPMFFVAYLIASAWCLTLMARCIHQRARSVGVGVCSALYSVGAAALPFVGSFVSPLSLKCIGFSCTFLVLCALAAITNILLALHELPDLGPRVARPNP